MHRPIKGFEEPGGWARARRWCAVVALLGGAALCVLTLTPPPRGELVSAGAVVRLLGAAVGLAGAAALLAAASPPRPVYEPLPTTVRPVRPGRLALRCVTALSLLLCIGSAVLCVRSYWGSDYLSRRVPLGAHASVITSRIHRITWTRGIIRLAVVDQRVNILGDVGPTPSPEPVPVWGWGRLGRGHAGSDRPAGASFWNQLGFYAYQTASAASFYDERERGLALPAWLPVAAFALLPLASASNALTKRSRLRAGRCVRCGYDLRATTGLCPECGATSST